MKWIASASNFSSSVDSLAKAMLVLSSILAIAVWALMIYFSIRYHASVEDAPREPVPAANPKLEFALAGMIFLFGLSVFIYAAKVYYRMYSPPSDALTINVIAKQWMWIFHAPNGRDEINELRIPANTPIRLIMTSEDVIHSFYVPAFRIKQDVLPGRYTSVWFEAKEPGTFRILCAQYCGTSHSQMLGDVVVVAKGDMPPAALNEKGAALFQSKGCAACHSGEHPIGPNLKGLLGRRVSLSDGRILTADESYIRRSILEPNADVVAGFPAVMPSFQGQLSEQEILSLIDYIKEKGP